MSQAPTYLLPTPALVERLIAAERQCMTDWLQTLADLPGNPFGIAIGSFGQATALVCRTIPAQVYNRVFGLTVEDRGQIPAIIDFYAKHGASPVFDLNPYAIPPYWVEPNVFPALAQAGLTQGAFHQILYRAPTQSISDLPAHLTISQAGPEDSTAVAHIYEQVWGGSGAITVLLDHPRFRCYIAAVDGVPAALGFLHIANGIGSMANGLTAPAYRGRGCQTALLFHRIAAAAEAGCDLLASQCMPGVTSQNNQLRAGFQIAGSKGWWVRM